MPKNSPLQKNKNKNKFDKYLLNVTSQTSQNDTQ